MGGRACFLYNKKHEKNVLQIYIHVRCFKCRLIFTIWVIIMHGLKYNILYVSVYGNNFVLNLFAVRYSSFSNSVSSKYDGILILNSKGNDKPLKIFFIGFKNFVGTTNV